MRKPLSTRVHGVLDYMTAAFLHTLPRVMGWDRKVTRLLDCAGASATAYSLVTRYELGVVKVLPMKAHLALDALSGAALIGAAAMLDDEDDEVRGVLAGIGLFEISAALLTRTTPRHRSVMETVRSARLRGTSAPGGARASSMPQARYPAARPPRATGNGNARKWQRLTAGL